MLGPSDGQLVCGVVMDDLWDGAEGGAVLPQHVTAVRRQAELHVHEALTAPGREEGERCLQQLRAILASVKLVGAPGPT